MVDKITRNFLEMWECQREVCSVPRISSLPGVFFVAYDMLGTIFNPVFVTEDTNVKASDLRLNINAKNFCVWKPTQFQNFRPDDLGNHFSHHLSTAVCLTSSSYLGNIGKEADKNIRIIESINKEDFLDWAWVFSSVFKTGLDSYTFAGFLHTTRISSDLFRHYIAYLDETPISICSIFYNSQGTIAGLYNGASTFNGRKLWAFSAIVKYILEQAFQQGVQEIVAQCNTASYRTLSKYFGFREVFQYDVFFMRSFEYQ